VPCLLYHLQIEEIGIIPRSKKSFSAFCSSFARKVQESGEPIQTVRNPAGTISQELLEALRNAFQTKGRTIIRVDGEEDLAVLACLFLAPEGIKVVYGWPGRGMLLVTTTTATRSMAEALWKELEELE